MRSNQHVVPHERGWAVRGEGRVRATSFHRTQLEAVEAARTIARRLGGEVLIHGRSGRIRRRDTTGGHDPMPPRG